MRRVRRHLLLLVTSGTTMAAVDVVHASTDAIVRVSFASAYAALALLCVTLLIGPLNALRGRPNPTSTNLRRDVGIWAGILGLVHTLFGLNAHFRGRMWEYFVYPLGEPGAPNLRTDAFGFANYTGLGAAAILAMLLALSNDASLRRLGTRRWKSLQRWNYGGFVLILVHGVLYQVLEDRTLSWSVLFGVMVLLTVALQTAGFLKRVRARGG